MVTGCWWLWLWRQDRRAEDVREGSGYLLYMRKETILAATLSADEAARAPEHKSRPGSGCSLGVSVRRGGLQPCPAPIFWGTEDPAYVGGCLTGLPHLKRSEELWARGWGYAREEHGEGLEFLLIPTVIGSLLQMPVQNLGCLTVGHEKSYSESISSLFPECSKSV